MASDKRIASLAEARLSVCQGCAGQHNRPVAYPDASRVNSLLTEICREWGYCLPPGSDDEIRRGMPEGADAIVDLIIRIELRIEPVMAAEDTHRYLRDKVVDWLFSPHGRGAASGLPI